MFKMKISIFLLLFGSSLATNTFTQGTNEECPFIKAPNFNIFIPGYRDTIQANGIKARTIEARTLTNGFELWSSDTLVRLRSFQLVFDDRDGNLYSKTASGAKIIPEENENFSFQKISSAALITIDRITVEYKGHCYVIPGQVYYAK